MLTRSWFVSLTVAALNCLVLGAGASGCSRNLEYETLYAADAGGQPIPPTIQANPAAYETVRVQSQAYVTPGGAQANGYAVPGAQTAADPNAVVDPNAAAVADPNAVAVADLNAPPSGLVGEEILSDGAKVQVVTYVHTYPQPIETYPRVYWSERWYYNVNGNFVYYSPYYGGWCSYWGPPSPLIYSWNMYYPWAPYSWGMGYYGHGYYWGGAGYNGWHSYGQPPAAYRPTQQANVGGPTGSGRHNTQASNGGPTGGGNGQPFDAKRPNAGQAGAGRPGREPGPSSARRTGGSDARPEAAGGPARPARPAQSAAARTPGGTGGRFAGARSVADRRRGGGRVRQPRRQWLLGSCAQLSRQLFAELHHAGLRPDGKGFERRRPHASVGY